MCWGEQNPPKKMSHFQASPPHTLWLPLNGYLWDGRKEKGQKDMNELAHTGLGD